MKPRLPEQGFTLIQISILLLVAGIMLTFMLPSTRSTLNGGNATATKMNTILTAMRQYETANAALPCPADANLAIGNTSYGVAASYTGTSSNCTGATAPKANYVDATNHVAIGMVPVKTLGLPSSYATDAFGNDITYAVDTNATVCFQGTLPGQIAITDNGSMATTIGALVSHGADGHGAWIPLPGAGSGASRLNANSSDTDEHMVNAHGLSGGGFPTNYSTINSMVTSAENTSTTFVRKPPTSTFDDIVVYKSNLWTLNAAPAAAVALYPSMTSYPANTSYYTGQTLTFVMTFPQVVTVTGTPEIAITLQSGTVYATYASGSGTTALTFSYTVKSADYAPSPTGISVTSPIATNGGSITEGGIPACLPYTTPSLTGVLVNNSQLFVTTNGASAPVYVYNLTNGALVAASQPTLSMASSPAAWFVSFTPTDSYAVVGGNAQNGSQACSVFSSSNGTWSAVSNPFTNTMSGYSGLCTGGQWSQAFTMMSADGNYLYVMPSYYHGYSNYPNLLVFQSSGAGQWALLGGPSIPPSTPSPQPGGKPTYGPEWMAISPDNTYLLYVTDNTSSPAYKAYIYKNNGGGSFSQIAASPNLPYPTGISSWQVASFAFSPNSQYLIVSDGNAPSYPGVFYVYSVNHSTNTFTYLKTVTGTSNMAAPQTPAYSPNGNYVVFYDYNTYVDVFAVSGTTFTPLTLSGAPPPRPCYVPLGFAKDNTHFACTSALQDSYVDLYVVNSNNTFTWVAGYSIGSGTTAYGAWTN